jgi:hypothetical protein
MLFSPEAKPSIRAKITALNIHGACREQQGSCRQENGNKKGDSERIALGTKDHIDEPDENLSRIGA